VSLIGYLPGMQGLRAGIAGLVVVACVLVATPAHATPLPPGRALMVGDSLTYESRFQITAWMKKKVGWTVASHSYGATAPCDWNQWLPNDIAAIHPSVIGVLTAGNTGGTVTTCMFAPMGSAAYYAQYRTDLAQFFATATASGARVVFFPAPPFADPARQAAAVQITKIATALAPLYHGVSIANTVKATLGNALYKDYKPCIAGETAAMGCVNGLIPIRTLPPAPDAGLHLCPKGLVAGDLGVCSVYSSGELRFGKAVVASLTNPPPPRLP
jgi:hypothetical protein